MLKSIRNWLINLLSDKPLNENKASENQTEIHIADNIEHTTETKDYIDLRLEKDTNQPIVSQALPLTNYDEELYYNTKLQWQLGDWESAIKTTKEDFINHPNKAKIALYIAASHAQLGNDEFAREYTKLALEYGCTKKQVATILISGVYNSLAKVAYVNNNIIQSQNLFEESAAISGIKLSKDSFIKSRMLVA